MNGAMFSSERGDWGTPDWILERVRLLGPIKFDPCTNLEAAKKVQAELIATGDPINGLEIEWPTDGLVYMNPPYGSVIKVWCNKAAKEALRGVEIVSLVPARVDTSWWRTLTGGCGLVGFMHGRVVFAGAPTSAPFPSALVYHGRRPREFKRAFFGKASFWGKAP